MSRANVSRAKVSRVDGRRADERRASERRASERRATRSPIGSIAVESIAVEGFATRKLRIALPPDHDPAIARPLAIFFDGQNLFGDEGSFAGGWHADAAVARLARARQRPIVVGIDHGGVDRLIELSPYRVLGKRGRGHAFLAWVCEVLVPQLRARFSVLEGPRGVLLGGASLGGLAASYAHFTWPSVVGSALAMSPSFWIDDRAVLTLLSRAPRISRLYLDGGLHESKGELAPRLRRIQRHLLAHGYPRRALKVVIDPKGAHQERSWRRRLPAALRFLYPLPSERA